MPGRKVFCNELRDKKHVKFIKVKDLRYKGIYILKNANKFEILELKTNMLTDKGNNW